MADIQSQMTEEMTRALAGSLQKIGNDLLKLDRISKDAAGSSGGIGRLEGVFGGLATRLLGPVGLVAGLYQVSNALSNVAAQSVQLQAFSRNTGLATDNIKNMQLQLEMMGKSSAEAKATIGQLAGALNDFNTNQQGSSLHKELIERTGGADLINKLNAAKNVTEQIAVILKGYQAQPTERQKRGYAEAFNTDPATLEGMIRYKDLVASTFKANEEALKKYHESSVIFTNNISGAYEAMSGHVIKALNDITGGAEGSSKTFETIVRGVNSEIDAFVKGIKDTIQIYNEFKEGNFGAGLGKIFSYDPEKSPLITGKKFRWGEESGEKPFPQGEDPMGHDYANSMSRNGPQRIRNIKRSDAGTSGATDFSGMRRSQSLEEEQTTATIEIRDILKRMEEGGGGTGGGGDNTGGRGGLGARLGMHRPEGIPDMPGSPRGSSPGVGAARGRVGAGGDPRGMESYIRESAKARGIDPDTAVAVAKSEGLSTFQSSVPSSSGPNGRENSWGAFQLYKGGGLGNEFQKATGLDPADPKNEKATIDFALDHAAKKGWGAFHGAKNTGISRFAGIGGNTGVSPQPGSEGGGSAFSGMGFGGDVRERQKYVAGTRRGALDPKLRTAFDYASSKTGLTVDVTSGGQRMPGAEGAVGSHRHDNGRAGDFNLKDTDGKIISPNDPRAIEFYRYAAQGGVTGGGEGYMSDPNKIHLDTGTERMGAPVYAGSSAFRNAIRQGRLEQNQFQDAARARMDAAKNSGTDGSISAKVDFTNVPPGVKTSADMEGDIFKELQVNKSRQGEVAGGSPGQPFSGVW